MDSPEGAGSSGGSLHEEGADDGEVAQVQDSISNLSPSQIVKLQKARSRLYRSRFLQPNTHFSAFFEIYKICNPSHRSDLKISANFTDFRQLVRARSRLYRSRFLQPNTHFAAFFEIYKICNPSHRSQRKKLVEFLEFILKISRFLRNFAKFCENFQIFQKILKNFAKSSKILENFAKFL